MPTLATITNAKIVAFSDPADITDTSTAAQGVVNIKLPNVAGQAAFITLEPVSAAVLAALSLGACTVTITQP